jgi:uncharacterized membrane-anchored protein YjiN (DUF445 family)
VPQRAELTPRDAERRRALIRMKSVAAGLLLTAALVWLLCVLLGHGGWVGYVQAAAEASMVGALADWFAVTALFRHPLGLPIPHTAILPRKKDQLGASLGEFVQSNFLSADVISDKVRSVQPGYKFGQWLADPEHARRIGDAAGAAIGGITEVMRDDDVQSGLEQVLVSRLRDAPKAPFAGRMVDLAIEAGHDQRLLVAGVAVLRKFLDENRQVLRDRFAQESPKWVPNKVDDRVFARAYTGLQHFLDEVADDPEHPLRKDAAVKVRAFAQQLRTDPEMELKVTKLVDQVLDSTAIRGLASTLWSSLKHNIITMSGDPDSVLRQRLEAAIVAFGEKLRDDPALQAKLDVWFDEAVRYLAYTYRSDIADLVTGTVARWDAEETSRRIELQVGRDLQFIRVNGTVVGGLAGLVIYTISQIIS